MRIADAHNDLLMSFNTNAEVFRYLNFCKQNGVVKLFTAYYFNQENKNQDKSLYFSDIQTKFSRIKHCDFVTTTFENIGFVEDYKTLLNFLKFKPFCATLTWNYENKLAGGVLSKKGLSKWGKRVTTELNQNNILVDVAHLNEKSFWDVAEIQGELFCSHTASSDIYPIKRNLNNQQLVEIGKRKGYVGLCLYNSLLGGDSANFETIRRHLDKFLEFAGTDCVGFGTDFNGTGEQNPKGISMDYLGMQDLYDYLLQYYGDEVLKRVFYKNLLDFEHRITSQNSCKLPTIFAGNKKEQQQTVHKSLITKGKYLAGEQRFEL